MEILIQLWLPILVSSIVVFVASSLAWMVLPHHKADVKPYPDEQALRDHLAQVKPPPGAYMWPCCGTPDEMKSEEFKARFNAGPWGNMTLLGAKPNFARNLVLIFVFYVVVGIFVGYITSLARATGAPFIDVFRVAGAVGVLAYCAGSIPNAVFFGKPGRFIFTDLVDGVVYGLLTGLVFGWLWP
jgi:hypothetical protein